MSIVCVYDVNDLDGLVQDCSNSSALAMELLQSCTKPSTCFVAQFNRSKNKNEDKHIEAETKVKDQHFTDDIFKYISLNENFQILNKISLKYLPSGLIDNMTALDNGFLSTEQVTSRHLKQCWYVFLMHICVTRPQ